MSIYETLAEKCNTLHTFTEVCTGFNAVTLHPVERIFPAEEENAIEAAWQQKIAAKAVSKNDARGALLPTHTRMHESDLHLSGYATDFKHYITTRDMPSPEVWLTGPSAVTRLLGGDEPVYVFGERKSKNLNTGGMLEFMPGGYLKAKHLSVSDPFESTLEEELEEETGIWREQIASLTPLWYGELAKFPDGRMCRNVILDYVMDIRGVTPEQVEKAFALGERKHTRLEYVQESALAGYLDANLTRFNTRGVCTIQQLVKQGVLR